MHANSNQVKRLTDEIMAGIQLWMMATTDLHAAFIRRIYVMSMDWAFARASSLSEEKGDDAFTVAW